MRYWTSLGALLFVTSAAEAQSVRGVVQLHGAALSDAVVFLERSPSPGDSAAPVRARVDQRDLTFVPRVLVVTPGSTVEFPNSDPVMHNVFHPGAGEDAFDLGTYSSSEVKTVRFERPGLFVLLCHVHPEMVGYVAVVPSVHHAVTTAAGEFRIADVPAGTYRVHVWHRRVVDPAMTLTVDPGRDPDSILLVVQRRGRRGATP